MNGLTILIVDDETATREGLLASLDFPRLGIENVLEASNGKEGLRVASDAAPDIVLSDVRMPQMDGVRMLERIREFLPDCVFIFMSGFSDKEYLRAAIRLRAVSYVDKPLNFQEVDRVLREAVSLCRELREQRDAATIKSAVTASRLALRLTSPVGGADLREFSYLQERYGKISQFSSAATVLLRLPEDSVTDPDFATDAEARLSASDIRGRLRVIGAEKHPGLFVFHLFQDSPLTAQLLRTAAEKLSGAVPEDVPYYIVTGPVVSSVTKLYDSFRDAALRMEQAYFLPPRAICSAEDVTAKTVSVDPDVSAQAAVDALTEGDGAAFRKEFDSWRERLSGNTTLPRRTVQAAYYRVGAQIPELRRKAHLQATETAPTADIFFSELTSCFSFEEMHTLLAAEAEAYFRDIADFSSESAPVFLIREYIRAHYSDPYLSTKEISEHVRLSASYACTLFKNETGKTLNQFLTEYRMERAKKYLADPRESIAHVASSCGYSDSNYFGKAFKKYTGLSPSEYRDSQLR